MINRFQMALGNTTFSVFDEHDSLTPHFVHKEMKDQTPFPLVNPKTIIDIGANTGIWAFWMAKVYPSATIYALEPVENTSRHLVAGISYNQLTNVKGFQIGVGAKREKVLLGMDPTNSGASSRYNSPERACAYAELFPLDDVLDETGPADLIKVDVEGEEFTLFETFTKWDMVGALVIELHPWLILEDEPSQTKLIEEFIQKVQTNMHGKPVEIQSSNPKFARKAHGI